jgi:hypothetical protein
MHDEERPRKVRSMVGASDDEEAEKKNGGGSCTLN